MRIFILLILSVCSVYVSSARADELVVVLDADYLIAPQAYLPNDADGTQFTASWSRVSGASQYELDVFSLDDNMEPIYYMQNEIVKSSSLYSDPYRKVTGLNPQITYYYVVRSVKTNGTKSNDSNVVEVIKYISSIDAPVATAATDITPYGFTANWETVPDAVGYQINGYKSIMLTEDSTAVVLNEDFSGITKGTVSNLSFDAEDLNNMTKESGWLTDHSKAYAAGYYVMYPSFVGKIATPAINFNNDGTFFVTIKAAAGGYGTFNTSNNTIGVALVTGDNLDNITVIESAKTQKIISRDFSDYTFIFTKGYTGARLMISYTLVGSNTDKLYIDEINVNQDIVTGSIIDVILGSTSVENVTSANINLDIEANNVYFYTVKAIGRTVIGAGSNATIRTILSKESNSISFQKMSGVDNITVDADNDAPARWFDLQGRPIAEPSSPGLYIMKQGDKTIKTLNK